MLGNRRLKALFESHAVLGEYMRIRNALQTILISTPASQWSETYNFSGSIKLLCLANQVSCQCVCTKYQWNIICWVKEHKNDLNISDFQRESYRGRVRWGSWDISPNQIVPVCIKTRCQAFHQQYPCPYYIIKHRFWSLQHVIWECYVTHYLVLSGMKGIKIVLGYELHTPPLPHVICLTKTLICLEEVHDAVVEIHRYIW